MKKTLKEELERIHRITYGEKAINEGILDWIFGKKETKKDDPKKADVVSDNVTDFFNTLEKEKNSSNGLSQQEKGSYTFQKGVESMQIGLILLGYELPRYGVDGLFGPETANAVNSFKKDNNIEVDENGKITTATPDMLSVLIDKLKQRGVESEDLKKYIDPTGSGAGFTELDLNTDEGFDTYAKICQKFIDMNQPNPLQITGEMMASSAKKAYNKYQKFVPPELALSQLVLEGGIRNKNLNSRPIRTKNPFNVGNVDSGGNIYHGSVQGGIDAYYMLIASKYLGKGVSARDLVSNFVNKSGNRYASAPDYESKLNGLVSQAHRIATPIINNSETSMG